MLNLTIIASMIMALLISGNVTASQEVPEDLLSGPTLEQEEVTNEQMMDRRMQEVGSKTKLGTRVKVGLWLKAMELMELDSRQKTVFRETMAEYRSAQKSFQDIYGNEISEIRKTQNAMKAEGMEPSKESRSQIVEIMKMAPDVGAYQETIWATLTAEQQVVFTDAYQKLMDEEIDRQDQRSSKKPNQQTQRDRDGFSAKDSKFRDKNIAVEADPIVRNGDALDATAMKRIKFLRKLQQLKQD
tara:strand:- start:78 stop:806 length:729 start_codon:yes stop_codon:yes gene_type:complete